MLVILLPEQVPEHWGELKHYVEMALPVHKQVGYDMSNILLHILGGVLLVAVLADKRGVIIAVFTITVERDQITKTNNLVILTGYATKMLEKEEVEDMLVTLRPLARSKDCGNILFYTDIEQAIKSFELGGGQTHNFVMWEV
jgi:hypothetical protein